MLFAACAGAVFGAMTWLTMELRALERREAEAKADAAFQASIRTALWTMDSYLAPFLTKEAVRSYLQYSAFYSPDLAYKDAFSAMACKGDFQMPSQLLYDGEPQFCRLHFQVKQDGSITTPRLPSNSLMQNEARWNYVSEGNLAHASALVGALEYIAPPEQLRVLALDALKRQKARMVQGDSLAAGASEPLQSSPGQQQAQGKQEWAHRQQTASEAYNTKPSASPPIALPETDVETGPLAPVWVGDKGKDRELMLLRMVRIKDEQIVQGVWVNWPDLRDAMLGLVQTLTPGATLVPTNSTSTEGDQLAGIPAVLVPGPRPAAVGEKAVTPISATLVIAWGGVVAATVAIGLVIRAIMELGERRGRFVSAVTHELRTPLTTFCLYSQMLADGMIREEPARREYLVTLKRESQRLARIVENVLGYARLSEVRAAVQNEWVDAANLLDRIVPGLVRRAADAGMQLVVESDLPPGVQVRVDPQTVERILANLVDNSCKYACGPSAGHPDRRIHVRARAGGGFLEIQVADHGPGIPAALRRHAFRAFNRASRDNSNTAPGLGLGLSLARGLARELGGDLRILSQVSGMTGATLSLTIPATILTARAEPAHA